MDGITLLVYAGFAGKVPNAVWLGLGLLVIAAMGGLTLNLAYHWK